MAKKRRSSGNRRSNGKVARLPAPQKDTVEQMLLAGMTYREIVEYLQVEGYPMSQMAICTYAKKYLAEVQMLNIAQENFKMMMEEIDKYPNLDTTEGIIRVLSSFLLNAITSKDPETWQNMDPDRLLREATSLIRAASYKKRVDVQNQSDFDAGVEAARKLIFEALAKERPDLYKELNEYLSDYKKQGTDQDSV